MFVYWSKKEKWYRDMESVSSDYCENCNSKREHTYRLYEERRKHYSVLSGPIKRSVRVICEACKGESKPEKKHEKQLIAKFRARILITEGFELMEQQLNHGKALKKFRESMKNLDNFFKGLTSFKHADFYAADLQSYNELTIKASYGSAACCIELAQSRGKIKLYEEAKSGINFLELMLPDNESVKELKNAYLYHTQLEEKLQRMEKAGGNAKTEDVADILEAVTGETVDKRKAKNKKREKRRKLDAKLRKKAKDKNVRGAMPFGWKPN